MADGSAGAVTRTSILQRPRTGVAGARGDNVVLCTTLALSGVAGAPLLTLALKSIDGRRRARWNSDGKARRRTRGWAGERGTRPRAGAHARRRSGRAADEKRKTVGPARRRPDTLQRVLRHSGDTTTPPPQSVRAAGGWGCGGGVCGGDRPQWLRRAGRERRAANRFERTYLCLCVWHTTSWRPRQPWKM